MYPVSVSRERLTGDGVSSAEYGGVGEPGKSELNINEPVLRIWILILSYVSKPRCNSLCWGLDSSDVDQVLTKNRIQGFVPQTKGDH